MQKSAFKNLENSSVAMARICLLTVKLQKIFWLNSSLMMGYLKEAIEKTSLIKNSKYLHAILDLIKTLIL